MKRLCCVVFLSLVSTALHATDVSAEYQNGIYVINARFNIEGRAQDVIHVLTDFENIADLNPAIVESEVLDAPAHNKTKVRTVVKDCVLLFCKTITRVEHVRVENFTTLEAEVIPFLSDLRQGYTKWDFQQNGNYTEVMYQSSLQPKFWIPPLIRSHTVTNKIKKRMLEIIMRLQMQVPKHH